MKIKITSFAMDSFLSVIKCTVTVNSFFNHEDFEEDYMFFMPLEPKPSPGRLAEFVNACKAGAAGSFVDHLKSEDECEVPAEPVTEVTAPAVATEPETAPAVLVSAVKVVDAINTEFLDECPKITPEMAKEFRPITDAEHAKFAAITPTEVIEKPKARTRTKKKPSEIIDVAPEASAEAIKEEVTHTDVMFDRTNKEMLAPIVAAIAAVDADWKSSPALVAVIRDALNATTGIWIYNRDGILNKGLPYCIAENIFDKVALPAPFFEA